jgi:hypothetical protein
MFICFLVRLFNKIYFLNIALDIHVILDWYFLSCYIILFGRFIAERSLGGDARMTLRWILAVLIFKVGRK